MPNTRITKKQKIYIIIILNACSAIFLLPAWGGLGCDAAFDYETPRYTVTGSCQLGLVTVYLFPKYKVKNEDSYIRLKGLYMAFRRNVAIYTYDFDDSKMEYNRNSIRLMNNLKHRTYRQFHIDAHQDYLTISRPSGSTEVELQNITDAL